MRSAHTLGWNFKSFHEVNRKFERVFFSIPRCYKKRKPGYVAKSCAYRCISRRANPLLRIMTRKNRITLALNLSRQDTAHMKNRGFVRRGAHLYAHDFCPAPWFSFLYGAVWSKTTKPAFSFDLLYSKIWNFNRVCVLKFLSLGRNLVLWYELNKKVTRHFVVFSYARTCKRKPTWWSQLGWLAKLAWYDVTWKPSIRSTSLRLDPWR